MLHTLVKRVEGTEEFKEIKRHISTPSSSDSGAKKKEVPNIVRVNLCSFCLGHRNLLTCSQKQEKCTKPFLMNVRTFMAFILVNRE